MCKIFNKDKTKSHEAVCEELNHEIFLMKNKKKHYILYCTAEVLGTTRSAVLVESVAQIDGMVTFYTNNNNNNNNNNNSSSSSSSNNNKNNNNDYNDDDDDDDNKNNNNNNIVYLDRLSTRNMSNCSEEVQIHKYKTHAYKTPKTACVQTIMLKHLTKQ